MSHECELCKNPESEKLIKIEDRSKEDGKDQKVCVECALEIVMHWFVDGGDLDWGGEEFQHPIILSTIATLVN